MPYHVEITTKSVPFYPEYAVDLTKGELLCRFVQLYRQGLPITTSGKIVAADDIERIRIIFTRQSSSILLSRIRVERQADPVKVALPDEFYLNKYGKDVTDDFITAPPETCASSSGHAAPATSIDPRKVFVIYGRDKQASNSLFTFLASIHLHPVEWSAVVNATGKPNPYILEILDKAFSMARAAVVLMTGDDVARLRQCFCRDGDPDYEKKLTPQARANVLFEAGMAMGRFPDRTVLVERGTLRPFSDIAGLHVVRLDDSAERRKELADKLQSCGCQLNLDGTQWLKPGTFTVKRTPTSRRRMATTHDRHGTGGAGECDLQEGDARQTRHKPQAPYAPEAYGPNVYQACLKPMLHTGGELVDDAKANSPQVWHVPPDGESSPVLSGPYVQLPSGTYRADFRLRMQPHRPDRGRVSCDIAYSKGDSLKTLKEQPSVKPPRPGRYEDRHLIFDVTEEMKDARFEFRVFQVQPGIELWVDTITITQL